jgi:hypothetical protein
MLDKLRAIDAKRWEEGALQMLQEHVTCFGIDGLLETSNLI